jgi:hypothetical protein
MSDGVEKILGFDPFNPSTYPEEFRVAIATRIKELQQQNLPLGRIALGLQKHIQLVEPIKLEYLSDRDFPQSQARRDRNAPHIHLNEERKMGFSSPSNLRRAIRNQTEDYGFIPKSGFRGLEECVDFEFVSIGNGKSAKTEIWVSTLAFIRLQVVTPSMIGAKVAFLDDIKSEASRILREFEVKSTQIVERQVQGRCDRISQHERKREDNDWFASRGLSVPTDEELRLQQVRADQNKILRMKQRFAKIMRSRT